MDACSDAKVLRDTMRRFHIAAVDDLADRFVALVHMFHLPLDTVRTLILDDKRIGTFHLIIKRY